ncbi:MAG: formylglycine-generating enzyme family protein [Armatimonadota bacterium]
MRIRHFDRLLTILIVPLLAMGIIGCHGGDQDEGLPGARTDGQELILVPGGSFIMGSDLWDGERPPHRVTLSNFWIGKYEVTNAQYRAFCSATGRKFPPFSDRGDNQPVVGVSWYDAAAYCTYYNYTMPTEAQWEYAARGTAGSTYPWGNGDTYIERRWCCYYFNLPPNGWTFPVGSFPKGASWCGALDMAGNVREWTADWFTYDYYGMSVGELNPHSPDFDVYGRVIRGGGWNSQDFFLCRSAYRTYLHPTNAMLDIGFRVAINRPY